MNRTRFYVATSILSVITLAGVIGANTGLGSKLFSVKTNAEKCDHSIVGYHERVEPTTSSNGHIEYWRCCLCHEVFCVDPRSQSQAEAIRNIQENDTDDLDGRSIPKLPAQSKQFVTNANLIDEENYGYIRHSYVAFPYTNRNFDPNGVLSNYNEMYGYELPTTAKSTDTIYLSNFDFSAYSEISFCVCYSNDGSYLQAFTKGRNFFQVCAGKKGTYQADYNWHEIRIVWNSYTERYDIYCDGSPCVPQYGDAYLVSNLNEIYFGAWYAAWRPVALFTTEIRGVLK